MSDKATRAVKDKPAAISKQPATVQATDPGEQDQPPPLTADLVASYRDSHHRLLLTLCLVLAFLLSCFPVSDPDIYFNLRVGQMVTAGEFPWGEDSFSFAAGDHAPWIHSGWLGDVLIYELYQLGGGPLLVFLRAVMVAALVWMLMGLGQEKSPRLLTVLVVLLGVLTLGQRLYFRTELFSLLLLGITIVLLAQKPKAESRLQKLHNFTAGRWYWMLPILFVLWANLDAWFFLGLGVVVLWCAGSWIKPGDLTPSHLRSLTIITVLCLVASCCSPFHVKALVDVPNRLFPATAHELRARFEEQKQQNPQQKFSEQQRLFESPWTVDFFQPQRGDSVAALAGQAPLLPLCYPGGLSFSEWAYYPLCVLVLLAGFFARRSGSIGLILLLLAFLALGGWQSRFIGFFAVVGMGLAVLFFQSQPLPLPRVSRFNLVGGQFLSLVIGLFIQALCVLHLIPSPDFFPSSLGHVHPRGFFGFAFRSDHAIEEACEELGRWRAGNRVAGHAFHVDWTDVVAYDSWFNPGGRHFFDRRHEVHDASVARSFFVASDAIFAVFNDPLKKDLSNLPQVLQRQTKWQELFKKYDIGYIVVKRRSQHQEEALIRGLLREPDKNMQPVWKPLQLHNGQIFALAWVGSPHWQTLKKYEFSPGEEVFRRTTPFPEKRSVVPEKSSFTSYLLGDAERRPAAIEETAWHLFFPSVDASNRIGADFSSLEMYTVAARLAARLANPLWSLPAFPYPFSNRQSSAGSLLLALESARRSTAELSSHTTASQRFEAWSQYLLAITSLTNYEQMFSQAAQVHREPLRLFVLRQTALAALDAQEPYPSMLLNSELAKAYRSVGALDAALDHYLLARQFIDRHSGIFAKEPGQTEKVIKSLDSLFKDQLGITPDELKAQVARQTNGWMSQYPRSAQPGPEPVRDLINRAGMALRMGLPRRALEELVNSGVKSPDVSLMACQVYTILGQHDVVFEEFLSIPELRQAMDPLDYHYRASLGEWCLGHPDRAAGHRLTIAQIMDQSARQSMLDAAARNLLGTSTQPIGSVLVGTMMEQQAAGESLRIADQRIAAGLLYLEAGRPQQAAEEFRKAVLEVEPATPWRTLLERYYLQITGDVMK